MMSASARLQLSTSPAGRFALVSVMTCYPAGHAQHLLHLQWAVLQTAVGQPKLDVWCCSS